MTDALIMAKEYLNVTGYIILWVNDRWRIMDKHGSRPLSFFTDAELIAFAKSKGFEVEG